MPISVIYSLLLVLWREIEEGLEVLTGCVIKLRNNGGMCEQQLLERLLANKRPVSDV